MEESSATPDLVSMMHHEHEHLSRLFDDIQQTFSKIAVEGVEPGDGQEVTESATADLETALDEMLHHFSQEEEVLFVAIERRFPALSDDIAHLIDTHARACDYTRELQRLMAGAPRDLVGRAPEVLKIIQAIHETLEQHSSDEHALFDTVLEQLDVNEHAALLAEMRQL
jgi:hemerythrin-like domain-containing protein